MSAQNASALTSEPLSSRASATLEASRAGDAAIPTLNDKGRMADIPLSPEAKITVERRGEIVLIGVNRPQAGNRFDPDAFYGLAKAYYDFDNDPSLRAAVFFGHGENFSAASTWTPSRPWPRPASRSRSPMACSIPSPGPST